jgi:NAD+ kinase
MYKRIGITVKSDLRHKDEAIAHVLDALCKEDIEVFIDPKRAKDVPCTKDHPPLESFDQIDLLIVVGGDGTILRVIREMQDFSVPILSVNRGAVGFLAEIDMEEVDELLPKFLHGEGEIEKRNLLHVRALRGEEVLLEGKVLNEAVIAQGAIARLLDLKTNINNESVTTFRADGLILSTPTGSTAYSLAAGGPIVHPQIEAMVLTPLNAYSFAQKPLVIPGSQRVSVEILKKKNRFLDTEVSLTLDGQVYHALKRNDIVEAHMDDKCIQFLRRKEDTFYGTLRKKLKWGDRPGKLTPTNLK